MTGNVGWVTDADATPIHRALGLTDVELSDIVDILGRDPNRLELSMFSVMWSEHCSYKSSRIHLKRLPTEGEGVLVGPGENAGVMDVGDGIAAAIRIESHNHPSYIEPYQGAATGAGGILRDIFTMGARPIALMDPLRFGPLDDPRSRWVAEGVVSGISGYGNSVGVPTVGGEVVFDSCYKGNPLVNVLCLGILPVDRLVLAKATGAGNLAVLLGSSTGRDGIGGVSVLASAGFEEGSEDKRPAVQVGDPFEEKRLIEACLALLDAGLVVGIQDLGGAGLTCAASETAANGKMGMDFDVSAVPRREDGMEPFEVMTSESQERMLAIVEPDKLDDVLAIARRWEVQATVIGTVTDSGRLRIVTAADVQGMLKQMGTELKAGDCVALHTGQGNTWSNDRYKSMTSEQRAAARAIFAQGEPGFGVGACEYMASKDIAMTMGDTSANDAQPGNEGEQGYAVPCHTTLQPRRGIWNLENVDTKSLVDNKISTGAFVWAPLRIIGATGSPGNPVVLY